MPTAADISSSICATLAMTEPDLDTSIGSVVRKIIDAVAASATDAFTDQQLTNYQYDIDSMSAGSLDSFVRLFGMDRLAARAAVGVVTFTRTADLAALAPQQIYGGTQVQALTSPVQYVNTMFTVNMAINQTSIDIPVQAVTTGSIGNIGAGQLTVMTSSVPTLNIATVNTAALTGGTDSETDAALRDRWKATVFRNLAGTTQMYVAMALGMSPDVTADPASPVTNSPVTRVNVLGPCKTWQDRISIVNGTSPPISFGNPAHIYSSGIFLGGEIGALDAMKTQASHYTVQINNGPPPGQPATITFSAVSPAALPDGDYDIQYDYVPTYSRNDPFGSRFGFGYVNNRIDIWVNGVSAALPVVQACSFSNDPSLWFSGLTNSPLNVANYRKGDGAHPVVGDIFMPLAFTPVVYVPPTMTVSGMPLVQGIHYDFVNRIDAFGSSPSSSGGVAFRTGLGLGIGTSFNMEYYYNQVPELIQNSIESQWRLMGTDVMVHAGIMTRYRFHLAVVYTRGFGISDVKDGIDLALGAFVNGLGFDSTLQVSDVLQVVHNVPGVDNVRFLTATDNPVHYAIEPMLPNGTPFTPISADKSTGRALDLYFDDARYPQYFDSIIVTKTRSTFGVA